MPVSDDPFAGLGGREEDDPFAPVAARPPARTEKPPEPDLPYFRQRRLMEEQAARTASPTSGLGPKVAPQPGAAERELQRPPGEPDLPTGGSMLTAPAALVGDVFEGIAKTVEKVPVMPTLMAAAQAPGALSGALVGGILAPDAWWAAFREGEQAMQERHGKEALDWTQEIRSMPGVGTLLRKEYFGDLSPDDHWAVRTGVTALQLFYDIITDPLILAKGGGPAGVELLRYAASGRTAVKSLEAVPRIRAALMGAERLAGSPMVGVIYGPEVVESTAKAVAAGDIPSAIGAALVGGLMVHGVREDFRARFGRAPTEAETAQVVEGLAERYQAEKAAMTPEVWEGPPPPASAELGTRVGGPPIPEQLRTDTEVRVDVLRAQGIPTVWGTPEPAKAPLPARTAPYIAAADNALQEAVQAAERAILDAPAAPPKVDDFTSPGISQGALSPEELSRAARKETYYKVNRDGTVTYQGHQPDPIGALKPGEGVVKVLPGLDPMVTQASGPDSKVLERFTLAAKKSPELLGVPERSVAEPAPEGPPAPPEVVPGSSATLGDLATKGLTKKDFPGFVEVKDPRTGRVSYRRPDYAPDAPPPLPGTPASPETLGQRLAREQGIGGPPKPTEKAPPAGDVVDLGSGARVTFAPEEGPPLPPGLPASRATGGVPQPSPAAPPRSVGHVAFVGDVKTGIVEFFEIRVGDEAHIYSAPADQPLTPAGVRKPKSWVGLADDDTRARVAAMQRLAKRERARRGRLQAGFDPAEIVADIIDHHRAKRAEDRVKLNAAAGRAGAPGQPPAPAAPSAGGPPPPPGAAPRPSAPSPGGLPKYAGSINLWQRVDHGEDVLDLFQETYRIHQPLVDEARRGEMSLAQIRQIASSLGDSDAAVERALARKPGQALNAEKLWAINEGLKETSKATIEHAKAFLTTPEIQRTPEMEASLIAQLARHTAVFASVSGANSEAGRALGILNRIRVAGEDARKLQDVIQNYGRTRGAQRETIAEIATLLSKIPQEDVRALGKFVRQVTKPTRGDKIYEYWINALLSGPPTHVSNTLSGVLGAALMPVELGLGATGNALLIGAQKLLPAEVSSRLPRVEKVRYFGEMLHAGKQLLGALDLPLQVAEKLGLARTKLSPEDVTHVAWNRGIREATYAALQAWKTEMPTVGDVNKAYETGQLPGAIGGRAGRTIRTPSRLLLMQDQFFQALIHRMSLNARAYRQAMKEGHTSRLAVADRMAELLENPTQVLKNEAVEEAVYRTFNTELGPIGKDVSDLRQKYPLLKIPLTFIRTPVNIVYFGLERTPGVGTYMTFGRALKKFADGELDAGKLSDESAKALLGLGLAWGVATLVQDGVITGSGPKDPAERRTLEASGWKPSSIRLGNNYYQYSRIEPLGITVNMIADFVETAQVWETDVDKVPSQIMYALTRNLMDKTWLSGITGLFKTVMDWERYGEGYALRTATSLLPNFFAYTARAMDPKRAIPRDPLQAVVAKAPGGGKLIEALGGVDPTEYARALDIWGREEVLEDTWFERFASPFRRSPVRTDLVTPHLIRLEINLNPPSKTLQDWKDPETGKPLPQPQGLDAQVLAQARGYARYALASMVVSNQDFLRIDPDDQREYLHRQLARGSTIVTRRAKALLYAKQPLTMKDLVGELMEQGPPPLE